MAALVESGQCSFKDSQVLMTWKWDKNEKCCCLPQIHVLVSKSAVPSKIDVGIEPVPVGYFNRGRTLICIWMYSTPIAG